MSNEQRRLTITQRSEDGSYVIGFPSNLGAHARTAFLAVNEAPIGEHDPVEAAGYFTPEQLRALGLDLLRLADNVEAVS